MLEVPSVGDATLAERGSGFEHLFLAESGGAALSVEGSRVSTALKRCVDVTGSLLLLVMLSPLLTTIAVMIRLDSQGPALFRQRRVGRGDIPFSMLKFRTMHLAETDEASLVQTSRYDPRVTQLGRLLRRTSLDELPQLVCVLAGDMSLVGPRPHAIGTRVDGLPLEDVVPNYNERHCVRPGITGLAQISACRGALDSREKLQRRVALDLEYIERRSLLLDVHIMLSTLRSVLGDRDAY